MPLFFILSGLASKDVTQRFGIFIRKKILSRIIPAILFSILLLVCQLLIWNYFNNEINIKEYLWILLRGFFKGKFYSRITWFLTCLFTVEIINFFISPLVYNNRRRLLSFGFFFIIGSIITSEIGIITKYTFITPNFWYIHEAILAFSFFQFGVILRNSAWLRRSIKPVKIFYLILFSVLLFLTFNLNEPQLGVVLMISSSHGNPALFLLSALAGSLVIILLAQVTPTNKIMLFWGKNSLVLLLLNGFFRDIINPKLVKSFPMSFIDQHLKALLLCSLVTLISMIICIPLIWVYNNVYPRLINEPLRSLLRV